MRQTMLVTILIVAAVAAESSVYKVGERLILEAGQAVCFKGGDLAKGGHNLCSDELLKASLISDEVSKLVESLKEEQSVGHTTLSVAIETTASVARAERTLLSDTVSSLTALASNNNSFITNTLEELKASAMKDQQDIAHVSTATSSANVQLAAENSLAISTLRSEMEAKIDEHLFIAKVRAFFSRLTQLFFSRAPWFFRAHIFPA